MARIGMTQKFNPRTKQSLNGELGLIIGEMGRAMWNADRKYIAEQPACSHESWIRFTPAMWAVWNKYVEFCWRNPNA